MTRFHNGKPVEQPSTPVASPPATVGVPAVTDDLPAPPVTATSDVVPTTETKDA